jgi:hypothetical protein
LFAIPLEPPAPLLRPTTARKIGSLPGFTHAATGADLSADGKLLAVCSVEDVRIYRRDADGRWVAEVKMNGPKQQVEAVCWDGLDLILASEDRQLFRITERNWRTAKRSKVRRP